MNQFTKESQSEDYLDIPSSEIVEIVEYLLENYQKPIKIETLSWQAEMGGTMFFNEFRRLTGLSPNNFLNSCAYKAKWTSFVRQT
ncbi:helix-turn-helix transcriptional regulator [Bacillus sp. EB106-08-02-XG196]|nr:helix-turn-helix transcriptional regulator [Bacillus sp. EB106-08-02-XG196]